MNAIIKNVNIRGREIKQNKKGEDYILVRFEEETGKPCELVDKDLSRAEFYQRNTDGDLVISIDIGRYTTIRIVDFKKHE